MVPIWYIHGYFIIQTIFGPFFKYMIYLEIIRLNLKIIVSTTFILINFKQIFRLSNIFSLAVL